MSQEEFSDSAETSSINIKQEQDTVPFSEPSKSLEVILWIEDSEDKIYCIFQMNGEFAKLWTSAVADIVNFAGGSQPVGTGTESTVGDEDDADDTEKNDMLSQLRAKDAERKRWAELMKDEGTVAIGGGINARRCKLIDFFKYQEVAAKETSRIRIQCRFDQFRKQGYCSRSRCGIG